MHEVLGGTAEADKEVVIVWINNRTPALIIGKNGNRLVTQLELPALGVVTGRCKGGVAHEFPQYGGRVARTAFTMTPYLFYGLFIVRTALAEGVERKGSCGAQTRRCGRGDERSSRHHCHTPFLFERRAVELGPQRHASQVRLSEGLYPMWLPARKTGTQPSLQPRHSREHHQQGKVHGARYRVSTGDLLTDAATSQYNRQKKLGCYKERQG